MKTHSFSAVLEKQPVAALWTILVCPFNVHEVFGKKGNVPVRGTMNGLPFRQSLVPLIGSNGECHFLRVNKEMREAGGMELGKPVQVELELDTEERLVEAPEDLAAALRTNPAVEQTFEQLARSHRFEYIRWLESTKNPETRQKRILEIMDLVADGKKSRRG